MTSGGAKKGKGMDDANEVMDDYDVVCLCLSCFLSSSP